MDSSSSEMQLSEDDLRHITLRAAKYARAARSIARLRQADGGWLVGFASASPAAALEWRRYATVSAVTTLRSR